MKYLGDIIRRIAFVMIVFYPLHMLFIVINFSDNKLFEVGRYALDKEPLNFNLVDIQYLN